MVIEVNLKWNFKGYLSKRVVHKEKMELEIEKWR
jgi:hypothetical protein